MKLDEFIAIVELVKNFKIKLEKENITQQQQINILKIYIQDLTSKINTNLLKVV